MRETFLCVSVIVTVVPAIAAPLSSVTVPNIRPALPWAMRGGQELSTKQTQSALHIYEATFREPGWTLSPRLSLYDLVF